MTVFGSSFLSQLSLLATIMMTTSVKASLFDHLLPPGLVPPQCYDRLDDAGICIMQNGCHKSCFNVNGPVSASRLANAIDFFYLPTDAEDCFEFELPICPITTCCRSCLGELNTLYRCIIRNTNGLSSMLMDLSATCTLSCQEYLLAINGGGGGGDEIEAEEDEIDIVFGSSNSSDTNATDTNATEIEQISENRTAIDYGY